MAIISSGAYYSHFYLCGFLEEQDDVSAKSDTKSDVDVDARDVHRIYWDAASAPHEGCQDDTKATLSLIRCASSCRMDYIFTKIGNFIVRPKQQ